MSNMRYEEANGGGSGSSFVLGAICGAAAGAALALLFAPKSGDELRRQIAGSADNWRRKASDAYRDGSERMASAVDRGNNMVRDAMKSGKSVVDEVVDQGREAIERGKAAYRDTVADQPPTSSSVRSHGLT